ncbi:condensation domain-containing protein [Paenibacillus sp.]|jgi:hypothetical protein|uniref:condensation domain-containing protein n=1 Tax=Paenibacillus sp. TaxID=58172 RepID=UPI002832848C|nr:condensation domain-containing protein [Paenibacillus sp.]MDR0268841.1 condensation domain-containing protein [Paenibacillus sp.]
MSDETLQSRLQELSPMKRKILLRRLLEKKRTMELNHSEDKIAKKDERLKHEISFPQESIWLLQELLSEANVTTICNSFIYYELLEDGLVRKTLERMVDRHAMLRSVFEWGDGSVNILIKENMECHYDYTDIRALPSEYKFSEAKKIIDDEFKKPFDLINGPLWKIKIIQLEDPEIVLSLFMHHLISDGWSYEIFLREFIQIYNSLQTDNHLSLPKLELEYVDYAHWDRNQYWIQNEAKLTKYWTSYLENSPSFLNLETDHPYPEKRSFNGDLAPIKLDETLSEKVRTRAAEMNVTVYSFLLAAWAMLLNKYTNQNDILIVTPVSNRVQWQFDNVIGCFVDILPIRTIMSDHINFTELVEQISTDVYNIVANKIPFSKLIDSLNIPSDTQRPPLCQVMFVFHKELTSAQKMQQIIYPFHHHNKVSEFDLTLELYDDQIIGGGIQFNSDIFYKDSVERMSQHFCNLITSIIEKGDRPVSQYEMM